MDLNSADSLQDIENLISQLDQQLQIGQIQIGSRKSPSVPVLQSAALSKPRPADKGGLEKPAKALVGRTRNVEERLLQAGVVYQRKKNEQL